MLLAAAAVAATVSIPAQADPRPDFRSRLPQDEVIYFMLPDRFENGDSGNDRGGLSGDRSRTGFDPTAKGFYHGGDLKGIIKHLDYIQELGATALWVGPIFKNKAVQGPPGHQSAGYHGYWITDFTRVDPHFGTNADFKSLVDAAHARGLKVYMDIVVNHTADVIQYQECAANSPCPYRNEANFPYQRRGGTDGKAINPGFAGDGIATAENFAKLTRPDYAYTPYVPLAERTTKVPAWLNDSIYYHNRGNTTFVGESATKGDFSGLDDIMTENPRVLAGMIDIFGDWIDRFGIDGFRIDTARHVNPEFWQAFVPAMQARAAAKGIPHFHIFGEVAEHSLDPGVLAEHTRVDRLPAVLDFAFREAVFATVAGSRGTNAWETLLKGDALYANGFDTAVTLPTFTGNHDDGRIAHFIRKSFPGAPDEEVLKRVELSNALLLSLRGVPTIYSGDEQGFTGDGGDQDSREDMFGSKVADYNDNVLIGTETSTATPHFGNTNPLFRQIATLARIRVANPALTRGRQTLRAHDDKPGLLAISRFDPETGREILLAFNTSTRPVSRNVQVETATERFHALAGQCPGQATAPGSVLVELKPLEYAICEASQKQ
jgi:glycosidase